MLCTFAGHGLITAVLGCDAVLAAYAGECPAPDIHGYPPADRLATGDNPERAVLRQLLGQLDLEGVLIQADALHTQRPFFGSSRSREPTSC